MAADGTDIAATAVERGARLVAAEHGSDVYGPNPSSGEYYAEVERDQYRAEAQAVIRDLGGQLLRRLTHLADDWPTGKAGHALFTVVRQEVRELCDIPVGWRPDPAAESDGAESTETEHDRNG